MDRNAILGMVLIAGIFIVWSLVNKPSAEELERRKYIEDSIAIAEKIEAQRKAQSAVEELTTPVPQTQDTAEYSESILPSSQEIEVIDDSVEYKTFTLENELVKLNISEKGGRLTSVELKQYQTHDSLPLILFHADSSKFGLALNNINGNES